jgi:cysteine-rich repeat protein
VLLGGSKITAEICGNGIDDDGDGLTDLADPDCQFCGNGAVEPGEECDDGNNVNGDGCDKNCVLEQPANRPPVAVCANRTVVADASCGATASIDNGSFDPDGNPITCTQTPVAFSGTGATTVILTCSDGTATSAPCTATVTVVDSSAPTVTCPAPQVLECTAGSASASFTASAADNCGAATATCLPPSGSTFSLGTTPVTCSASDAAGNAGSCSFNVTVHDTLPPVVTVAGGGALWPPNHKARTIALADCGIVVADSCQGPLSLGAANAAITCVTSDEPRNSAGAAIFERLRRVEPGTCQQGWWVGAW